MATDGEGNLSRDNLLWETPAVAQYLLRDERYARIRERANSGIPTLSAQVYADILVQLHRRAIAPDRLALNLEELAHFRIAPLDREVAMAYREVHALCLASARNRDAGDLPEGWFVWNVALNRLHGCRILTNDRARYAGIVADDDLV